MEHYCTEEVYDKQLTIYIPETDPMMISIIIGLIGLLILLPLCVYCFRLFVRLINAIIDWLNRH